MPNRNYELEEWEINFDGDPLIGVKVVIGFIVMIMFLVSIILSMGGCGYPYEYENYYDPVTCEDRCYNICDACWKYTYQISSCMNNCRMECKYSMCHIYNGSIECQELFAEVCTKM